jgi:outer membrane immunogenic protein
VAARGHTINTISLTPASATFSTASEARGGWTVGAGFEYAIVSNLSVFIEYDFYDFGTRTIGFTTVGGSPRERESAVKAGANRKVGW